MFCEQLMVTNATPEHSVSIDRSRQANSLDLCISDISPLPEMASNLGWSSMRATA